LAVPDTPETQVFDQLANEWGVKLMKGSVFNVGQRLLGAAEQYQIDVVVLH